MSVQLWFFFFQLMLTFVQVWFDIIWALVCAFLLNCVEHILITYLSLCAETGCGCFHCWHWQLHDRACRGRFSFFSRKPYPQNGGCPLLCREWRGVNLRLRCCGLTFTSFSLPVSSVHRCTSLLLLLLGNRVVAGESLCCVPVGCDLLSAGWSVSVLTALTRCCRSLY